MQQSAVQHLFAHSPHGDLCGLVVVLASDLLNISHIVVCQ